MAEAGVYSFKIEGRLKDINYVKNITAYYRQKLGRGISSGKVFTLLHQTLKKVLTADLQNIFSKKRNECYNFESPKSRGEYLGKITEIGNNWIKIKLIKTSSSRWNILSR